jgi:LacI family transcriptional regulator
VEAAIRELRFVRNESARQLRGGVSRTLAYVMLDATNPFFTDVAAGIELTVAAADFSLFICNSGNRAEREDAYLARLVEHRVQGILITPVDPERPSLAEIQRSGTPLVIVDRIRQDTAFCSVSADHVYGGRLAVEHLVEQGHQRIAFVGGPDTVGQVQQRLAGARQAWSAAGRDPGKLIHLSTEALTITEGSSAGERLAGIPANRRPSAAFCANDLLALGLLQQTLRSGRRVPDDLAIVGYDDIVFAGAAAVPLTSVRQPRQQLGIRATELLLDEANNTSHLHERVLFTPELVARASTLV